MPDTIGQKFTLGATRIEVDSFPAKGTLRFAVRVNGLLAGNIIALVTKDAQGDFQSIDGFYVAGNRQREFPTARRAASALAASLRS